MEEDGRFNRHKNPVIAEIMRTIYEPLVKQLEEENNERIDLYQREIEILKRMLEEAIDASGYEFVGDCNGYRFYMKKDTDEIQEEASSS